MQKKSKFELSGRRRELLDALLEIEGVGTREERIPRRKQAGPAPLSFAQQRLWFLDQYEPGSPVYNISAGARLRGSLDVPALRRALSALVKRHEALRTTFQLIDKMPVQLINEPGACILPIIDLRGVNGPAKEAAVSGLVAGEAVEPFDLALGPLFRIKLIVLDEQEHVLLATMHHIVSDGWSIGIFIRELGMLYEAYRSGDQLSFPDLPIQYADFAAWQHEWLQSGRLDPQLEYWTKQLHGVAALELTTDKPRPLHRTYSGADVVLILPKELRDGIIDLGRREGCTLFMTLLAALNVLLYRYTGQSDLSVGTAIANRNRSDVEELIGFFVNTLVMRTDLSGKPTFRELLARTKKVALEAFSHQDLPFEKLVEEVQPERIPGRTPLFQVLFHLQNVLVETLELSGLSLTQLPLEGTTAKFDLSFTATESDRGIRGRINYNTNLFERETIERMAAHYRKLLEGVVTDPDERIGCVPLLTQNEIEMLITRPDGLLVEHPADATIHELFARQAAREPEATALIFEGRTMSYGELDRRANKLANRLRRLGVGPETVAGLCIERSFEMVIGLVGILKAGGAYVPLDPAYPDDRLSFLLEDSGARVVVTEQRISKRLNSVQTAEETQSNRVVLCLDSEWDEIEKENEQEPWTGVAPDNAAYVIYTSGSTGEPKGAVVTHYNVTRLLEASQGLFNFSAGDVWTSFHSISFDFSVWELWGGLLRGGSVVVVPYWESRAPEQFYQLVRRERVTVLNQTPSAFAQFTDADEMLGASGDLSLRLVIFGGEALAAESLRSWFNRDSGRRPALINGYGITETTVFVTFHRVLREDVKREGSSLIGRAIEDLRATVLDANRQIAPIGVAGEICVAGPGVGRCYLNRPELTAERFIPNPHATKPGERIYCSGDLGRYLGNGEIEYLGRQDHQVKIRGYRVEPGELESALRDYCSVRECAVTARRDKNGELRLIAYVAGDKSDLSLPSDLRARLREKLPDHMLPAAIVVLDAIPLTENGKIDRRSLPEPSMAGASAEPPVAPRNAVEEFVSEIFAELLGVEQIGIHDNFFDLGGHSLLATQAVSRSRKAFRVELTLRKFFEAPTVAGLSQNIITAESKPGEAEKIAAVQIRIDSMSSDELEALLKSKMKQRNV